MSLSNEQKNRLREEWEDSCFTEVFDGEFLVLRKDDPEEIADWFILHFDQILEKVKQEEREKIRQDLETISRMPEVHLALTDYILSALSQE